MHTGKETPSAGQQGWPWAQPQQHFHQCTDLCGILLAWRGYNALFCGVYRDPARSGCSSRKP